MYSQFYIYIYRSRDGIRCNLMDEEKFAQALHSPGQHVTEVECDNIKVNFNVAYPRDWAESDAHFLVNTQLKFWPIFISGVKIKEAEGGTGGPIGFETQDNLPF